MTKNQQSSFCILKKNNGARNQACKYIFDGDEIDKEEKVPKKAKHFPETLFKNFSSKQKLKKKPFKAIILVHL